MSQGGSRGGRCCSPPVSGKLQALGIPPAQKYAAESGPGFQESFALLRLAATRLAREVLKLLDATIFHAMLGNADSYAENFSRLEQAELVIEWTVRAFLRLPIEVVDIVAPIAEATVERAGLVAYR